MGSATSSLTSVNGVSSTSSLSTSPTTLLQRASSPVVTSSSVTSSSVLAATTSLSCASKTYLSVITSEVSKDIHEDGENNTVVAKEVAVFPSVKTTNRFQALDNLELESDVKRFTIERIKALTSSTSATLAVSSCF